MCGIVGAYYAGRRSADPDLIRRMNATLVHRGPDGDGFYFEPGIGFGHRRLSIIDLSGGRQPMSNEDKTVWITFNGEIYNFKEIARHLKSAGHRFETVSDTEAIIHAYEEYGERCLDHLRGMFAFAIWDSPRQRLFLARDRVGIKPLYYYHDQSRFIFASELKAILADPTISREIDLTALRDYLIYGYIPFEKTIFKRVRKLLPGHYARIDASPAGDSLRLDLQQYWDLKFRPDPSLSANEWIEEWRRLLRETVELHLMSDVPLGAFLSGGLDSSCVVAMTAQLSNSPVKTFCIGFDEEDFSELPYARQVAERYGTEHHELLIRPDAIDLLPVLAKEFDEPFGDSSAIPTYFVSKLARSHVTVSLSGDGGDELFAGYKRYADTMAALQLQRKITYIPAALRRFLSGSLATNMPPYMRGQGTLRRLSMSAYETYMDVAYCHPPDFITSFLHPDIVSSLSNGSRNPFETLFGGVDASDDLTRMQYLDTKSYLPEDILTKVDRASMLNSLEARVPLLDHKVLEFVAKMPSILKFRNGQGKHIFRQFLGEMLPANLLARPKMGFGIPLIHWFRGRLESYTREVLLSPTSLQRNFFNSGSLEKVLAEHRSGIVDRSHTIWQLLVFEHWCRQYLDSPSTS